MGMFDYIYFEGEDAMRMVDHHGIIVNDKVYHCQTKQLNNFMVNYYITDDGLFEHEWIYKEDPSPFARLERMGIEPTLANLVKLEEGEKPEPIGYKRRPVRLIGSLAFSGFAKDKYGDITYQDFYAIFREGDYGEIYLSSITKEDPNIGWSNYGEWKETYFNSESS